ncbi:cobalt ECF transporter T component CbiQ [Methanobrevibacter sp. TMH8]|uniref:cobalt ECF transporter T component CbiQ n=1 Tax=Methanobrevibacter sp. TMH8 TaxID=2848611 RepID=UPI001CCFB709|nr:cobalt ECF transporter T component CbiQ [Methanobrevibacter sp. TMH8]MBZ9570796.1 cobalt ECF transporter T component CbiQ [Methanobrevibacter sp. TMH8]
MNATITKIEQESWKDSTIHKLDGRIKLIFTVLIVVYAVYTQSFLVLLLLEIYLIILLLFSKVSIGYFAKRVLMILPFGGFIAIFQPFIKPGIVLFTLPLGLTISYEGILFGALLLSRLIVCLSAIVLLSSVTPLESIVNSMRKLGFPKEMSMILSMTVRYLFVFFDELENIRKAQKSRSFNIWNKKTSYLWRIKQIGYTIMMLFLKSFEKGEKVYYSMLARGYVGEATSYKKENPIRRIDYSIIVLTVIVIFSVEIVNLYGII